jgi:hypothetical protein
LIIAHFPMINPQTNGTELGKKYVKWWITAFILAPKFPPSHGQRKCSIPFHSLLLDYLTDSFNPFSFDHWFPTKKH